jgi:hypothetical protein
MPTRAAPTVGAQEVMTAMSPNQPKHADVAQRYRFEEVIGRGGMGTVWRATDLVLDRTVAVKEVRLAPGAASVERASARARAMREAHAAARIADAAAVTLHDVIEEDERLLLVMEHVDAPSLDVLVAEYGPLTIGDAARLGSRVAGALAAAHRRGVTHRDVKPSNVLVPRAGASAMLVDFGIAAIADAPGITASRLTLGSPTYMSPEQADGRPVTAASDVFSLGATLYFAVEGEGPFAHESSVAALVAVASRPPRPPERAGPLAPLLLAMMDKDPAGRPSVDEARRRLDAIAVPGPPRSPAVPPTPSRGAATRAVGHLAAERAAAAPPPAGSRPRRGAWIAGAAGLVGAAVVVVAAVLNAEDGTGAGGDPRDDPATTVSAPDTTGAGEPPVTTTTAPPDDDGGVPAGFVRYEDPQGGFRTLLPADFHVSLDEDRRVTEITSGDVRIGVRWFEPGVDHAAFREREEQRVAALPRYRELALRSEPFGELPGTFWEFEFAFNGAPDDLLHSTGRTFDSGGFAFGLFFRGPAGEFDRLERDVFAVVEDAFEPLAGAEQR